MTQLRLAYRSTTGVVEKQRRKKSAPSFVVLHRFQLLSWKIERLQAQRPAVVDVIEKLVDDLIAELDRGQL